MTETVIYGILLKANEVKRNRNQTFILPLSIPASFLSTLHLLGIF